MTCMYSSREVCLLYTPPPPPKLGISPPPSLLQPTQLIASRPPLLNPHRTRQCPRDPARESCTCSAGVSRRSGVNIARLGRRHSNYGGEGVQYPNIPEQKGRALLIHERAREEDDM
jgi:hypothetical protein